MSHCKFERECFQLLLGVQAPVLLSCIQICGATSSRVLHRAPQHPGTAAMPHDVAQLLLLLL